MSRPILVKRWRASSGGVAVFKYLNGNLSQVGSEFGAASNTSNTRIMQQNAVVQWKNKLYCPHEGDIWIYDVANSGDWDVGYDLADYDATASKFTSSIIPANTDDEEQLIVPYVSSASSDQFKFVHITTTGIYETGPFTFTQTNANLADAGDHIGCHEIFANASNVYFTIQDGSDPGLFIYDVEAETLSEIEILDHFGNGYPKPSWSVLDGTVYGIFAANDSINVINRTPWLWRLEGNSTVPLTNLLGDNAGNINDHSQNLLFNDGTDLFSLVLDGQDNNGWRCFRHQIGAGGGITTTDITSDVVPTVFSDENSGNSAGNGNRMWVYANLEDNPGGTPEILLAYGPGDTNPAIGEAQISLYRWNGPSTMMTFIGAGADSFSFAFPTDQYGGGHRTWSGSGELDSTLHLNQVNQTTIDLDLYVNGGGASGVIAEVYFNRQGNIPTTRATIESVLVGMGEVSANQITGLSPSGDMTRIRWSASADGVQAGDTPRVIARTFRN